MRLDPAILAAQDAQLAAEAADTYTRNEELLAALPAVAARHMATCLRRSAYRAMTAAHRLQAAAGDGRG